MAIAGALRKMQATRVRAVSELPSPWKARRKKARVRRVLWAAGLVVGLCLVVGLVWGALESPVRKR